MNNNIPVTSVENSVTTSSRRGPSSRMVPHGELEREEITITEESCWR
jgi:hypothetical protein